MRPTLLCLLVLSTTAFADDSKLVVDKVTDPAGTLTTADATAALSAAPVAEALAKCAVSSSLTGQVMFEDGKVIKATTNAKVKAADACVTAAVKLATVTATGKAEVTFKLVRATKAMFTDENRKKLDAIIDKNLETSLSKFTPIGGTGVGSGTGTGVGMAPGAGSGRGVGTGVGGGGNVEGDFVASQEKQRAPGDGKPGGGPRGEPVNVKIATGTGDFGGYEASEIDRVIKGRAGVFRACYQKELNRSPGIAGKLVIKFEIKPDGIVAKVSVVSDTVQNAAVASCLKSNVSRLKFPAKGAKAIVNYPFLFSAG